MARIPAHSPTDGTRGGAVAGTTNININPRKRSTLVLERTMVVSAFYMAGFVPSLRPSPDASARKATTESGSGLRLGYGYGYGYGYGFGYGFTGLHRATVTALPSPG